MNRLNVLVLTGGPSSEHEVSLATGREVVRNLDPQKYDVLPVVIAKDGKAWLLQTKEKFLSKKVPPPSPNRKTLDLLPLKTIHENNRIDVCFIALHGSFGEDGHVQAILDFLKIPYTGSGVLASALGMDKIRSRQIFAQHGLNVPQTIILNQPTRSDAPNLRGRKLPVVVKPNNQGSSIGVSIVRNKKDLESALKTAFKLGSTVLVEEYLHGTEVTCAVLGNQKPKALPVVGIVPKLEFFNFQAKYDPKYCDEIVPARISPKITKKVQEAALLAYKALGCRGFGRVDMIIKNGKVYVLEMNTIPGMTLNSLLPKAAKANDITFPKLLDKIIKFAYEDKVS